MTKAAVLKRRLHLAVLAWSLLSMAAIAWAIVELGNHPAAYALALPGAAVWYLVGDIRDQLRHGEDVKSTP